MQQLLGEALPGVRGVAEPSAQGFGVRPADGDSNFHWLYWGRCPVVRTRDANRLLTALEQHLSVPSGAAGDSLVLRLSACITANGEAILLPAVGGSIALVDRRLREAGAMLVDAPFAVVDPHDGELVVEPPTIAMRGGPRRQLVKELGTTRNEVSVPPGRYALAAWAVESEEGRQPRAAELVDLLGVLAAPTTERGVDGAVGLLERLRKVAITLRDVRAMVERLGLPS